MKVDFSRKDFTFTKAQINDVARFLSDKGFELNKEKVNNLINLIEVFESAAKREITPYSYELYHKVNIELYPIKHSEAERGFIFEVECDNTHLTPNRLEAINRVIEPDGILEMSVMPYGKTRLVFRIPDVYTPKEQ